MSPQLVVVYRLAYFREAVKHISIVNPSLIARKDVLGSQNDIISIWSYWQLVSAGHPTFILVVKDCFLDGKQFRQAWVYILLGKGFCVFQQIIKYQVCGKVTDIVSSDALIKQSDLL